MIHRRVKLAKTRDTNLRPNVACPMLAASLLIRLDYPLLVGEEGPDGYCDLYDGHQRKYSGLSVGIEEMDAIVVPGKPSQAQIRLLQLRTDIHKSKLTDGQKYHPILEIAAANPTLRQSQLAELIEIDETTLSRFLGLKRLPPEAMEAFTAGKFGLKAADIIAQSDQPLLKLQQKLAGMSDVELARDKKKKRKEEKEDNDTVEVTTLKIPQPGGIMVIIKAPKVKLATVRPILDTAARMAAQAKDEGLSAKSAFGVWKFKSKGTP